MTPCDSESAWSASWYRHDRHSGYDTGYDKVSYGDLHDVAYDSGNYEWSSEGLCWWRRPLAVRRSHRSRCDTCEAPSTSSSASRPLRVSSRADAPLAPHSPHADGAADRRPLLSRDRPLLFIKHLFL